MAVFRWNKIVQLELLQIWILFVEINNSSHAVLQNKEYCMGEKFTAICNQHEVVMVRNATFGRMKAGKCISNAHYCQKDMIAYVDSKCSGKKSCEFAVSNLIDVDTPPCSRDVMSYLEATFDCIPVLSSTANECYQNQAIIVKEPIGYISNIYAINDNVGKVECPWRIAAPNGKRISVTLLDFGIWSRQHDTSTVFCDQYATLVEQSTGEQFHVCGGHEREEHIYTSKTSSLEVSMLSATTTGASKYFILKYKIAGCEEYSISGAQVDIFEDIASVTCASSGVTWKMRCVDSQWTGEEGYCDIVVSGYTVGKHLRTTEGLLVVLCVGLIIGAICAICCTYIWIVCHRRCKRYNNASTKLYMKDRPVPLEPDYCHRYPPKANGHHDPLLQKNHTFIDPRTGMLYERYAESSNKPDILYDQRKPTGTLQMNTLKDNHIYNTLEPHVESS